MCRDCDFELMRMMLSGQVTGRVVKEWYDTRCRDCHPYCFHHRFSREKWITVFLSDFMQSNESKGRFDLALDFYTYSDYLRFKEYRNELSEVSFGINVENPRLSTFFCLSNYRTDVKPRRGHYYMNLDVLARRWHNDPEDKRDEVGPDGDNRPGYFIATFTENADSLSPDTPLLVQAAPLVYPQWVFWDFFRPATLTTPTASKYTLKVNNVEQGNWNEILAEDEPYLMFDIGTNAFGKTVANDIQRQLRNHPVTKDVDALYISHWHADHYNILTGMNHIELNHIKQLVCPSSIFNLTAFNIIIWFALNPNSILSVQNHPASGKWQKTTVIKDMLNLYVRPIVKSNPNNGGLLLFFNGRKNCVTLTGDANYSTVEGVTNDGITQFNSHGGYYMVVPHHGGNAGSFTCKINSGVNKLEAIISVGAKKIYNHPDRTVVSNLGHCFNPVTQTCISGNVTKEL